MDNPNLNLTNARDPHNVWNDPSTDDLMARLQSLDRPRALSVAGGAVLAALGLRQRGVLGGLLSAVGGALVYRALMGHDDVTRARSWTEATLRDRGWLHQNAVDEASEDSFPASDPPSH